MGLDTVPDWARELVTRARVARLGYLDGDDRPRVLPVTFAVTGGFVWTAIDDKPKRRAEPARVEYLRRRPEASLLVDEYDDDWSRLAWVQLLGPVDVMPAESARGARGAPEPGRDGLRPGRVGWGGSRALGPQVLEVREPHPAWAAAAAHGRAGAA